MIGHLYRYPHPFDKDRFIYVGQGLKRDPDHRSGRTSFGRRFKRDFPNIELSQPIREEFEVIDQDHLNVLETVWMFQYKTLRTFHDGMNLTLPGSTDYEIMGKIGGPNGSHEQKVKAGNASAAASTSIQKEENGRKGAYKTQQLYGCLIPMWARCVTKETNPKKSNGGIVSGRLARENGTGLFALSHGQRVERGRRIGLASGHINGRLAKEKGTGIFSLSKEQRILFGRIGAQNQPHEAKQLGNKITLCLRWNIRRGKACICGRHNNLEEVTRKTNA